MKPFRPSLTLLLGAIILFMGVVGLVLALLTGATYQQLTLESQQTTLRELVRLRSADLMKGVELGSRNLGDHILGQPGFIDAMQRYHASKLKSLLQAAVQDPPRAAAELEVLNLSVYGRSFNHLAELEEAAVAGVTPLICVEQLNAARMRTGLKRLQVMSGLCRIGTQIAYSVLMPIGGYKLTGYLVITTDPVHSLVPLADTLGLPVRIRTADGRQELYRSADWRTSRGLLQDEPVTDYRLATSGDQDVLLISVQQQAGSLAARLAETRRLVMLAAATITLFAMLFAFWLVRRMAIHPLQMLTRQLQRLRNNRDEIGRPVAVTGTREITELADGFNTMTAELGSMTDRLEELAFTDALTRLPNRYQLNQRLEGFTRGNRRGQRQFSLFLMDLDRFKLVNDTLGHHVGDQLLQQVGLRLQEVLRDSDVVTRIDPASRVAFEDDMVARLGGDEFAVILPDAPTREQAETVARKIIQALEDSFDIEEHRLNVGVSIGIVTFPEDGEDMHTLMRRADVAMYYAKKNRLGFVHYTADQAAQVVAAQEAG
ncbi:MAG TPA: diguanylate cyclase, partial [Chromatiales bacterium]|nr:diguanylate cyclase [Chromatiales bacterium]